MVLRAPPPAEERGPYVSVPRSTPAVFEIDPRSSSGKEPKYQTDKNLRMGGGA